MQVNIYLLIYSINAFFFFTVLLEDSGDSDYEDDNWDPMMADYLSPMNTVTLDPENYDSVTTGLIPREDHQVCRFFRANGTCYKGDSILNLVVKQSLIICLATGRDSM